MVSELRRGDGFIGHLERHLGQIRDGWSRDADGVRLPFQIVRFADSPVQGATTFTTLGLSDALLDGPHGGVICQELIFACYRRFEDLNIASVLQQLALQALRSHRAYLRGECAGPRGSLFPGSSLEAIYFALPVYWPDEFSVYRSPDEQTPIQLSWAIPIHADEAGIVREEGWPQFEELLMQDPDLVDLERPSTATGTK